jgi:hypothetical protein
MSKSNKNHYHFLEENQFDMIKRKRKPIPAPTRVSNPKDIEKERKWDWRQQLDELDELDESDKGINN